MHRSLLLTNNKLASIKEIKIYRSSKIKQISLDLKRVNYLNKAKISPIKKTIKIISYKFGKLQR